MPHTYMCAVCDEAITNPLCLNCLEREVKSWMNEMYPGLAMDVSDITSSFKGYGRHNTRCVVCGKKTTICSHCYYKEIKELCKNIVEEEECEHLFWPIDER